MSNIIDFDYSDTEKKFPIFIRAVRNLPKDWLLSGAEIYESQMKIEVPIQSSRLQSSIDSIVGETSAIIRTNTGYGKAVDEGRKGFTQFARNARALRFFWKGKIWYRKSTNIGPGRATKFKERTLINARPRIVGMIENVGENKFSEIK